MPRIYTRPSVTPPPCDVTHAAGQSPGGFHRYTPRANCGAVLAFPLKIWPRPAPRVFPETLGGGAVHLRAGRWRALQGLPW